MAEVFTWQRKPGATGTVNFRVREAQFGDGYSQVVIDGLNNIRRSWPMEFEGSLEQMQPIIDFFERHAGAISFWWTAPGMKQASLWRVPTFSMQSIGAGLYSVTAEFIQHFAP